ncbi:hypothetical protein JYJ95_37905 [Corallococcus exiguus]|uniref:hypothetical protein n=1 Tax=Corallococcus exiguus TaxID=83462 RepID=UPI001A8F7410|nr:hypothetical protein [Corallococcus exiguus]MBN8472312.1 hypothetical protein [Corallococcus exiguus]
MKKRLTLAACLAVVLSAPVALAQASTGASSSILDALLTPTNIAIAVVSVIGLFAGVSWLTDTRKRRIALAVYHAFHAMEDVKAECKASGKDYPFVTITEAALGKANEFMIANGWRPLKPREEASATLQFSSLHGEQKVQERAQEKALTVALGAVAAKAAVEGAVPSMPRG